MPSARRSRSQASLAQATAFSTEPGLQAEAAWNLIGSFSIPGCILGIRLVQLGALWEESYSGSLLKAAGTLLFRVIVPVGPI